MIAALAIALALGGATPLDEAARALAAGRVDQAGEMIAAARKAGGAGEALDRLTADHALASGATSRALDLYLALIGLHPDEALLLERAGLAALRLHQDEQATALLDRATLQPDASWRAWNLRGVAADRRAAFDEADAAYAHAALLAPDEAAILNNRGWSLMLRGRWAEAAEQFETALRINSRVPHGAANLELARAAITGGLPERRKGESSEDYAARLNDAGVIAAAEGDRPRAVAAFTQAIAARSAWFDRAAKNLEAVEQRQP